MELYRALVHFIIHCFQNKENTCVFKHRTLSRDVYANGALHCVEKISNKSPGLYKFEDVIN